VQVAVGAVDVVVDPKLVREARRDVDKVVESLLTKMGQLEFTGEMGKYDGKLHDLIDAVRGHAAQIWLVGDDLPEIDVAVFNLMTAKAAASVFKICSAARSHFSRFWTSYVPISDAAMANEVRSVPVLEAYAAALEAEYLSPTQQQSALQGLIGFEWELAKDAAANGARFMEMLRYVDAGRSRPGETKADAAKREAAFREAFVRKVPKEYQPGVPADRQLLLVHDVAEKVAEYELRVGKLQEKPKPEAKAVAVQERDETRAFRGKRGDRGTRRDYRGPQDLSKKVCWHCEATGHVKPMCKFKHLTKEEAVRAAKEEKSENKESKV